MKFTNNHIAYNATTNSINNPENIKEAQELFRKIRPLPTIEDKTVKSLAPDLEKTIKDAQEEMNITNFNYSIVYFNPQHLCVSEVQREMDEEIVHKILRDFDKNKVDIVSVNYNSKTHTFEVFDGQHTIIALKVLGFDLVAVKLYIDLTEEEMYEIFCTQYSKKKRIPKIAELNLSAKLNIGFGRQILAICEKHGVHVGTNYKNYKTITSIRVLNSIASRENGLEILDWILSVLEFIGWDDQTAYKESIIKALSVAYNYCAFNRSNYVDLTKLLKSFDTAKEFLDFVSYESTKHPEQKSVAFFEKMFNKK